MTDERLQELLDEAKHTYRVPAAPPLDDMWTQIEHAHFDSPHAAGAAVATTVASAVAPAVAPAVHDRVLRPTRRWKWAPAIGIAATLVLGVGLGRLTAPGTRASSPPAVADANAAAEASAAAARRVAEPLKRATSEYLDETVTLLASLPRRAGTDRLVADDRFVETAAQLLGTTRLLLDSPTASDPRMRGLLEDLELVLAQVARLRTAPRADELHFIAEAMDERDVVPRLRTVAASLSTSGY